MLKPQGRIAAVALAGLLVLLPATTASAKSITNSTTCDSNRFLATSGNAKGYVYVISGGQEGSKQGAPSARQYVTVKSYRTGSVLWTVSSGDGDDERPGYSNSCSIA